MSLQTWKDEFYPAPARDVKKKDALAHSLKKWEGLTKRNLKKHGVRQRGYVIKDEYDLLWIDDSSCSLCVHFDVSTFCKRCPLYKARGGRNCCDNNSKQESPYDAFISTGNPQPMIRLIKKAIAQQATK